jgi:hypothetical protein
MAWIGLIEEGSFEVKPLAQAGFEKGYLQSIKVRYDDSPLGRGPTGTAIRTGKPAIQNHIDSDLQYAPWREEALKRGYKSSAAFPLIVDNRVLGALNVYSERPEAFGLEEIQTLRAYAGQAAFLIRRALLTQGMMPEIVEEKAQKYELEPSECYIVLEEQRDRAFRLFEEHVQHGWQGLCITRENPRKVRELYALSNTQIFWLTDFNVRGRVTENLLELSLLIAGFVNVAKNPIVLLDGVEYLASRNGFEATYRFIQTKRDNIAAADGIMIIPVHPEAFPTQQLALLKGELKQLTII